MAMNWAPVKNFKREEWVHDPDRVLPDLVFLLDHYRDAIGHPVVIHVAWDSAGHMEDSTHYGDMAMGVDFHVEGVSLLDAWLCAERFNFLGLGLYPFWKNPGLHGDLRVRRDHPDLGRRWWRDDRLPAPAPGQPDQRYKAIDRELLALLLRA